MLTSKAAIEPQKTRTCGDDLTFQVSFLPCVTALSISYELMNQ
jgi:hypothetical protein